VGCAGHIARKHTGLWWENEKKRYHLEDLDVDGRIILKLICDKFEKGRGLN
jgi:hypothetical protein